MDITHITSLLGGIALFLYGMSIMGAGLEKLAAVMQGDTRKVLGIVFDRLYVLRNQLVHGGATWNSQVNRAQLTDAVAILGTLVPLIISVMMDHPGQDYGDALYPVV